MPAGGVPKLTLQSPLVPVVRQSLCVEGAKRAKKQEAPWRAGSLSSKDNQPGPNLSSLTTSEESLQEWYHCKSLA